MPAPDTSAHPRPPRRAPRPVVAHDLARIVLPLLVGTILAAFAYQQAEPTAAAETAYLARLVTVVLLAVAALAPTASRLPAWSALGALLVVTAAPPGTTRASATVALLLAALAVAAANRRWRHETVAPLAVALAIALQALLRPDLLLPPFDLRAAVLLAAAPAAAALSVTALAARVGRIPALVAGAATMALAPGLTIAGTLGLAAAAAGAWLGHAHATRLARAAAAAVLVVPLAWDARSGALAALAGLALAGSTAREPPDGTAPRAAGWSGLALAGTFAWAIFGVSSTGGPPRAAMVYAALALAVLLVPSAVAGTGKNRLTAGCALALLVVAPMAGDAPRYLTAGVVVLAVTMPASPPWTRLQTVWTATWLATATLAASYPWLRPRPVDALLALAPWPPTTLALGAAVLAIAAWILGLARSRWTHGVTPIFVLAFAMAVLAGTAPRLVLVEAPVVLADGSRGLARRVDPPTPYRRLVIESQLVESLKLPAGAAIGSVQLLDAEQRPLAHWRLTLGDDTAEWAADRPDVAARPGFRAPTPWSAVVAPSGEHFSLRFRRTFEMPAPADAAPVGWVLIRRRPTLPEEMRIVISRVELRP